MLMLSKNTILKLLKIIDSCEESRVQVGPLLAVGSIHPVGVVMVEEEGFCELNRHKES